MPFVIRQRSEGGVQHLPVLHRHHRVLRCQPFPVLQSHVLGPAPLPQLHQGEVAGDGQQPGQRCTLGTVLMGVFPGPHKSVLGHILSVMLVFQVG